LWTAAFAGLAVVGCSGGGGGGGDAGSGSTTTKPPPTSVPAWTRSDLKPVTQPVVAGGLFVLYVAVPGGLGVVGLDAASGRSVWQAPASRGHTTPGVAPSLGVVGGNVVLFQSAAKLEQLVALDAATGAQRWASPPAAFTGWPGRCVDDQAVVCTSGITAAGQRGHGLRYAGDSGKQLVSPVVSPQSDGRELGPELFDAGLRNPELLVATNGAAIAWKQPLAAIFNGPGLSTDHGWNFERLPAVGLFVGSVDGPPVQESSPDSVLDVARTMTAGFRIADGTTVWRDPGTRFVCSILPCPGQAQGSIGTSEAAPTLGLRVRATGTATAGPSREPKLSPGGNVKLEGFDLATGKTTWSFDAGTHDELLFGANLPQVAAETLIVTGPDAKPTELDLTNGKQRPAAPDAKGWCQKDTKYDAAPVTNGSGKTLSTFAGAALLFPCDPSGKPAAAPALVDPFVGPTTGGVMAWSEEGRVVAVRSGPAR